MNIIDRSEAEILWKAVGNSIAEDKRREVREQVIGDILWAYTADSENKFKGAIMVKNHDGFRILTLSPIEVGSALRIHGKGRGVVINATVMWCKKGSADIYKSGLLLSE